MAEENNISPDLFQKIWQEVVDQMHHTSGDNSVTKLQKAWLKLMKPLRFVEGFALISVPSAMVQDSIDYQLKDNISQALALRLGQPVELGIRIQEDDTLSVESEIETTKISDPLENPDLWNEYFPRSTNNTQTPLLFDEKSRLSQKYTFDNFVIGSSNRFAHAATIAVAEAPARAYNPLFIWGDSGLGKTHLLHATGHYAKKLHPKIRVRYVSTEEFTNDFINSLRDDRRDKFKKSYRETDILIIDDIQFLEGKEGIQEEFFHTFNTLHTSHKQIIISSDRSPRQLATLEDRLRTRFEWGLITDIQPPELETRIAILRNKAETEGLHVSDSILELIASRIVRNIRELEGALIRITAFSSLNGVKIDEEMAQIVLRDLVPQGNLVEIDAATIISTTAEFYGVSLDELKGNSKSRPIAEARQIAMYLCRELTDLSLPKIGQLFYRDHTTIMYADRKIRSKMTTQRKVYEQIQEITSKIKSTDF